MKILLLVTGFASHTSWAEGYAKASREHDVRVVVIPYDRWKFRMLSAGMDMVAVDDGVNNNYDHPEVVALDDDMVVIDGMLDATVLVAALNARAAKRNGIRPKIWMYMHENQLTTPFTTQDRDAKAQTHWHYGMAHYRSLAVVDGFIFNSHKHYQGFRVALPKLINEQSPRDVVEWHLDYCQKMLDDKCVILPNGLELQGLLSLASSNHNESEERQECQLPIILWNARLEEDKDPGTFLKILRQVKQRRQSAPTSHELSFQMIMLGTDPSKDQIWYQRFRNEFAQELIFLGWCEHRAEYSRWLHLADVVVSTAQHETFGISIVESVYCGAIPLLPNRLSYPELFGKERCPNSFYDTTDEAVNQLVTLLEMVENDTEGSKKAKQAAWKCIAVYDWDKMGKVYDDFFWAVARGDTVQDVRANIATEMNCTNLENRTSKEGKGTMKVADGCAIDVNSSIDASSNMNDPIMITEADDCRVQLYRPKSLRDHANYNNQVTALRKRGMEPSVHGGRRAMVRMIEAIQGESKAALPISFLTNLELYESVLKSKASGMNVSVYVSESQDLLNTIRGQKLNSGDSILAIISFPIPSPLPELLAHPPLLILEDVRNAENVGSILRTAFCLGITSVVASPTAWAALRDTRAARCSMGTIYYHRFYRSECLPETIQEIQKSTAITVYGVEIGDRATPVGPHGADRQWAAVLGNEDSGLTPVVAAACDRVVFVPQAHGDSLNVGHAAAITLYELGRENPLHVHDGKAACR